MPRLLLLPCSLLLVGCPVEAQAPILSPPTSTAIDVDPTIHLNDLVVGRSGDTVHVVGVDTNSPRELR